MLEDEAGRETAMGRSPTGFAIGATGKAARREAEGRCSLRGEASVVGDETTRRATGTISRWGVDLMPNTSSAPAESSVCTKIRAGGEAGRATTGAAVVMVAVVVVRAGRRGGGKTARRAEGAPGAGVETARRWVGVTIAGLGAPELLDLKAKGAGRSGAVKVLVCVSE